MAIQTPIIDEVEGRRTQSGSGSRATASPVVESDRRDEAIDDLLRVIDSSRQLRVVLDANEELCEASLDRLRAGVEPGHAHRGLDVAGTRLSTAKALTDFERARHQVRGTFICAQAEAGMNMKEIGGVWGISRQLAHRFYKEAGRAIA